MTTGRINQVYQMLPRHTHSPMCKQESAWLSSKSANVHISHQQHLFAKHCPARGTYNLTNANHTWAQSNRQHWDASRMFTHSKLRVIKQVRSTHKVSMTTKKLIGNSQRECLCTQTHSIGRWVPEASTSCHVMSSMSVEGCPPNRVCRQKRFAHKIALTARRCKNRKR